MTTISVGRRSGMSLNINYSQLELRIMEAMNRERQEKPVPASPLKHCSWIAFYYGYRGTLLLSLKALRHSAMATNFHLIYGTGTRHGSQEVPVTP
jgi:hypothetical protein